jgi:hypothetical protein
MYIAYFYGGSMSDLDTQEQQLNAANEDQFNQEMVAMRRNLSMEEILEGIATSYAAYERVLIDFTPEELAQTAPAPWGAPMRPIEMILDELGHDRMHLREIVHTSDEA